LRGEESHVLAEEQAALRRVAALVARGVPPEEVFAAVTEEVGRLLCVMYAHLGRYESDGTVTIVAGSGSGGDHVPAGRRWSLGGQNVITLVFETGRPGRIDGYADASGPVGVSAREDGVGAGVGTPVVVEGHLWGVMTVNSPVGQPLPADTEARLANFTELVATAIANAESRAELARLAEEQAALRRVATLVARGLPPTEIFAAVAEEVGKLVAFDGTRILRFEFDGSATVIAGWSESVEVPPELEIGARLGLEGDSVATRVFRTGRPARIDNYTSAAGPVSEPQQRAAVRSAAGAPIIVEGRLWGVIAAGSTKPGPLRSGVELRLAEFTELVATAIANAESRTELARLAEEQAALRRVATLVARGAPSEKVFAAVTEELGRLIDADIATLARLESGDTAVLVVAAWAKEEGDWVPIGTLVPLEDASVANMVMRTGRPTRRDNLQQASDSTSARARQLGVTSTVGTSIVVEGHLWGGISVSSKQPEPLPADTESRIADFAELVATAIANAESRTELAASRARIVTASDDTRRRIERDLHDGVQQRLVTLALVLRAAQSELPRGLEKVSAELSDVGEGLNAALDELREIARGIQPAILSENRPGVEGRRAPLPDPGRARRPRRGPATEQRRSCCLLRRRGDAHQHREALARDSRARRRDASRRSPAHRDTRRRRRRRRSGPRFRARRVA
jgi:GAF domain-containing protein